MKELKDPESLQLKLSKSIPGSLTGVSFKGHQTWRGWCSQCHFTPTRVMTS